MTFLEVLGGARPNNGLPGRGHQPAVDDAVAACKAAGAQAVGYALDVTDRAAVDDMVSDVKARFDRIDVMVNNAGITQDASSVVGIYGNYGQTNYAASKFGVIGFTKTWSRELGPKGVRVNAVAPGFIETPILDSIPDKVIAQMREAVPLNRLGRPEEIANVYAFLASDEASYINGTVIEVGGGMTLQAAAATCYWRS